MVRSGDVQLVRGPIYEIKPGSNPGTPSRQRGRGAAVTLADSDTQTWRSAATSAVSDAAPIFKTLIDMELKKMHFQYADHVIQFVNYGNYAGHWQVNQKPNITIVAICCADRYSEGYVLFYYENEVYIPKPLDSLL